MSPPDFREVFARYYSEYRERFGEKIPASHRAAAAAILNCRTPAAGGALFSCADCGHLHFAYHSCNHRLCPQCGQDQSAHWADKQKAKLLPVSYSLVTFTIPESLRPVFRSHQELCYGLFFQCTSQALKELAADPKFLGASIGFLGVLHTWTRQLAYHPHIHYILPEGGLTDEGAWRGFRNDGFLPVKKLSIKTRLSMQLALREKDPALYDAIPKRVWREPWVTHRQPVGDGEKAIEYLSRYVTQTALSAKRLVADDGKKVTIEYTESGTGALKRLVLTGIEFIRRFLQHTLPSGFKRVRYYGWLSPAAKARFERILALLDWKRGPIPVKPSARCRLCEGILKVLTTWHPGRAPPCDLRLALSLHEPRRSARPA